MVRAPAARVFQRHLTQWIAKWNQFWFTPVDPLGLSILRILAGSMLLYTHLVWGLAFTEFFGPTGWNDSQVISAVREGGAAPSIWWHIPEHWLVPVHWVCNAIIALFVVGVGGRFTAIACWLIAVSYANRSALSNFGLDQINCILMLYLAIGPSTRYLSIDWWWRTRRGKSNQSNLSPSISANVAVRLVQLHLCIIYLWAGLGKLQGEAWWNGQAVWLALANLEYQSLDLTWLAAYPRLLEILTHATIAWEIAFAFLVWPKASRFWILIVGVGMHLGIGAFLGMWTFGLIMICSYIAFVPSDLLWSWWRSWSGGRVKEQSIVLSSRPVQESSISTPQTSTSSVSPRVVLVTNCPDAIHEFISLNSASAESWTVVGNRHEAGQLLRVMPSALFLEISLRPISDGSSLRYLSVRILRTSKYSNTRSSASGRAPTKVIPK